MRRERAGSRCPVRRRPTETECRGAEYSRAGHVSSIVIGRRLHRGCSGRESARANRNFDRCCAALSGFGCGTRVSGDAADPARGNTSSWSAATRSTAPRRRCPNWRRSWRRTTASTAPCCSRSTPTARSIPTANDNIPGLEALDHADLLVLFTRFRDLPDEQMKHIVDYVNSGQARSWPCAPRPTPSPQDAARPTPSGAGTARNGTAVSGGRCSARPGSITTGSTARKARAGSFAGSGRRTIPILRGIGDGEIWVPTDVYAVRLPLPRASPRCCPGQVLDRDEPGRPAARGAEERSDDAGGLGQGLQRSARSVHHHDGLGAGPRRTRPSGGCWSTPATGRLGLEKKISRPGRRWTLIGDYKPSPFKFNGHVPESQARRLRSLTDAGVHSKLMPRAIACAALLSGGIALFAADPSYIVKPANSLQGAVVRLVAPAAALEAKLGDRTIPLFPDAGGGRSGLMPVSGADQARCVHHRIYRRGRTSAG